MTNVEIEVLKSNTDGKQQGSRVDKLEASVANLEQQFTQQRTQVDTKFKKVTGKVDDLGTKCYNQNSKLDNITALLQQLAAK